MRVFKILLAALFLVVSALYGYTVLRTKSSGRNIGPTITCPQEVLELSVRDPEEALLSGITAQDKQDGDLTGHVLIQGAARQITDNTTTVTYLVFDSDGNSATATRSVRYKDYTKPRFQISQPLVYTSTASIALLDRLQAIDCMDGDITNAVRVGTLDATGDPEIFTTDVQVTNSLSDTARLTIPIVVYSAAASRPEIELTDYLVYLNQGDAFRPEKYLRAVNLPARTGQVQLGSLADVKITSTVNTAAPGTYMVHYRYPYEGTTALAVLTVVVE